MDPHLIRKRQETILETYSFDYEKRTKETKKRTGRVPARLAGVLLLLLISVFAAGCSKTGTVYADPSETRTQGPGAAETGTAGRGGQPKGKTGMEALGTALKEESPESAPDESSDRSPDPAAGQSRTEEQTAETQAEGAQQAETQAEEAQEAETQTEEAQQAQVPAEERQDSGEKITEITFTAVGDNLINEVLYGQAADRAAEEEGGNAYDFSPCYAKMAPFIQEHDVNWIDIETVMTDSLEPSGYPAFSTPADSGRALICGRAFSFGAVTRMCAFTVLPLPSSVPSTSYLLPAFIAASASSVSLALLSQRTCRHSFPSHRAAGSIGTVPSSAVRCRSPVAKTAAERLQSRSRQDSVRFMLIPFFSDRSILGDSRP